MNQTLTPCGIVILAVAVGLAGCAKTSTSSTDATASATPAAAVSALPAAGGATPPGSPGPADTGAAAASASPAALATTSGAMTPTSAAPVPTAATVALTDISGVNGQTEITQLAQLGAVDPVTGAFRPGARIKRRDFIRWLVKANNVIWNGTPANQVKLADTTESASFPDVSTADPDFPYVQGMQDAGYSVGFPDKTFKPDRLLTREEMFAIKDVFDRGSVDPGLVKSLDFARNTALPPWKDKDKISKTYVAAIATGSNGGNDNFTLVYGASSLFHPKEKVTRAQAAVLVSVEHDHKFYGSGVRTSAQALASPAP